MDPAPALPLRVLLVEDSEDAAWLVQERLRADGFELGCARVQTAAAFGAALRTGDWEVILCDHVMPQFSSFEALTCLQQHRLDIPFIVVSGAVGEETAAELMRAGAHDFVAKTNLTRLAAVIHRELGEAQARRERHAAQEALRHSELLYHSTIDAMDTALHVVDASLQIKLVNRHLVQWCRQLGLPADHLVGRHLSAAFPFLADNVWREYHEVIRTGEPLVTQEEIELRGVRVHTETRKIPLVESGRVSRIVTLLHDVSQRVQAERAVRNSEQQYRLLAWQNAELLEQARQDAQTKAILLEEVNHRVKNNLASIIGLLCLEQRHLQHRSPARYREALEGLAGRIQGLAAAHQMLSHSSWAPLPLSELARQIVEAVLHQVPQGKSVHLEVDRSAVQVDYTRANTLALILGELVTNTVKYGLGDRDRAQIRLIIEAQEDRVQLEYRDDGPGYPATVLTAGQQQVGLYLIHSLVSKELRGELHLGNDPGAVARLEFPLSPARDPDLPTTQSPAEQRPDPPV